LGRTEATARSNFLSGGARWLAEKKKRKGGNLLAARGREKGMELGFLGRVKERGAGERVVRWLGEEDHAREGSRLSREREEDDNGERWVKGYGPSARWAGPLLALVAGLLRGEREKGQGRKVAWIRGLGFCFINSFSFLFKTVL
jgi:hypothetical protein